LSLCMPQDDTIIGMQVLPCMLCKEIHGSNPFLRAMQRVSE